MRRALPRAALAAVLVGGALPLAGWWMGCVQIFDIQPGNLVPGGALDGGVSPITGLQVRHFILEQGGVTHVPVDFRDAAVVYADEPDAGLRAYPGIGNGDGTFRVDGVPEGVEWYVKADWYAIGVPVYAFSRDRRIDLSEHVLGRADVRFVAEAGAPLGRDGGGDGKTAIHFTVRNLSPYTGRDTFELVAVNVGFFNPSVANVREGATVVSSNPLKLDASTLDNVDPVALGTPVIDGRGRNDLTYLTQATPVSDAGAVGVTRSMRSSTFTLVSGETATLDGDLEVLSPAAPYTVQWDHSAFTRHAGTISKSATIREQFLYLSTIPGGDVAGQSGAAPDLFGYDAPALASGVERVTLAYGDPFPSTWQRFVTLGIQAASSYTVVTDGGPAIGQVPASLACNYPMPQYDGRVLGPIISPVQSPLINGGSAFDDQRSVTTRPTITWSPPALGTPTTYYVSIREIVLRQGAPEVRAVAKLVTGATRVTVPPGILELGRHYTFALGAIYAEGHTAAEPLATSFPYCISTANTGALTP